MEAFEGRHREVSAAAGLSDRRRLLITGPPGIGKTAFARRLAMAWRDDGTVERILWVSFRPGTDTDWALAEMGRQVVGSSFTALDSLQRLPRLVKALAAEETLVVWDHLERVWGAAPLRRRPLLQLGVEIGQVGHTRLLLPLASQELDYVPYAPSRRVAALDLPPLDGAAAAALIAATAGEATDGVEGVAELGGGHPLTLRVLGRVLAREGAAALAPVAAEPPATRLVASFRALATSLGVPQLPDLLAPLPDGLDGETFGDLCGLSAAAARGCVAELMAAGLLEREGPAEVDEADAYFVIHDAIRFPRRASGAERPVPSAYRQAFLGRLSRLTAEASDAARELARRDLPAFELALAAGLAAGEGDRVAALADSLEELLGERPVGERPLVERLVTLAEVSPEEAGR